MKIKIIQAENGPPVDARIEDAKAIKISLPSVADGWRFNFNRHSKAKNTRTYVLVAEETPEIVEGCLIFEMRDKIEPYMAFVEIAPHNKGNERKYLDVASCLIAFACKLSLTSDNPTYSGYLAFDVREEDKEDEIKLMALYSTKYHAVRYGETEMFIPPLGGHKLIQEFLSDGDET